MRGIPKIIATRQDVLNLCNDLPPDKARAVLEKHKELLTLTEYQGLKKAITAKKRKETMKKNKARRQWARLHELEISIPAIKDEIDALVGETRRLTKTMRKAKAEKQELGLLNENGNG